MTPRSQYRRMGLRHQGPDDAGESEAAAGCATTQPLRWSRVAAGGPGRSTPCVESNRGAPRRAATLAEIEDPGSR
jgi:hypothetical protein